MRPVSSIGLRVGVVSGFGGLLPARRQVEIELDQLNGAVRCQLTDHRDPRNHESADHQEAVVSSSGIAGAIESKPRANWFTIRSSS